MLMTDLHDHVRLEDSLSYWRSGRPSPNNVVKYLLHVNNVIAIVCSRMARNTAESKVPRDGVVVGDVCSEFFHSAENGSLLEATEESVFESIEVRLPFPFPPIPI